MPMTTNQSLSIHQTQQEKELFKLYIDESGSPPTKRYYETIKILVIFNDDTWSSGLLNLVD